MFETLEPLKVEAVLRSEKMKLQYRKANKPNEINILDYTVIAALELQVPKSPIWDSKKEEYYCPLCNEMVGTPCIDGIYEKTHCENCGQRIDWSDEE